MREERGTVLLAVADGVGGSSGGDVAADAAIAELGARFFRSAADRPQTEALADAMRDANEAVLRAAASAERVDAASTLVAAAVHGSAAAIANLGDSRAYLVRDGTCRQLTTDHSGVLPNAITRFVGDRRGVLPDVFVEALRRGDRLVLCSDGLVRHVTPEEIAAAAAKPPQLAADALVALANERGGEDNITLVLYEVTARALLPFPSARSLVFAILAALVTIVVMGTIAALVIADSALPR